MNITRTDAAFISWQQQDMSAGDQLCEAKQFANQLESELVEAQAYADRLAAGLPDGMLPKDVENLRDANLALAVELADMTSDRDSETRRAKQYFNDWQKALIANAALMKELNELKAK
ncbi:hypothetical protein EB001_24340 [bacterium]|nr:hypothetical protein [bacterium]